ncbi:MAG: hypothetical protein ACKO01_01200 [Erythrobacter sp.]
MPSTVRLPTLHSTSIGEIEPLLAAIGQCDGRLLALRIDAGNGAAQPVDATGLAVVAGELHAVARLQLHSLRLEHLDLACAPLA